MMWWWPGFGTGWGIFMFIISIIFWILVFWLVIVLIRSLAGQRRDDRGHPGEKEKTPLQILQERYARGEINEPTFLRMSELLLRSKKEFEEKKKDLSEK